MDHVVGVMKVARKTSEEAEDRTTMTEQKVAKALESKKKVNRENESLKAKIKSVEVEIQMLGLGSRLGVIETLCIDAIQCEKKLQALKAKVVKTFRFLNEFLVTKLEFTIELYFEGVIEYKAKV